MIYDTILNDNNYKYTLNRVSQMEVIIYTSIFFTSHSLHQLKVRMAATGCCEKNANRIGICCFMDENAFKHKPLAEVVQNKDRQCTDMICLVGLILVFISQFILIGVAIDNGAKPELLWRGYDFNGNVCDKDNEYGAYTAWPALNHNINPSPIDLRICVKSCDQTQKSAENPLMQGGDYYSSQSFLASYCIPTHPSNFTSYSSFSASSEEYDRAVADVNSAKWYVIYSKSEVCVYRMYIIYRTFACGTKKQ